MSYFIRGSLFLLLVLTGLACARMAFYGSAMSAFTNDHLTKEEPYLWAMAMAACFIAPLWALATPKKKVVVAGLIFLLPPLAFCVLVPSYLGLGAIPIIGWYCWSVVYLRGRQKTSRLDS